jgi:hypothetical protein
MAGGTDKGLFVFSTLSVAFWGWVEKVGWEIEGQAQFSRHHRRGRVFRGSNEGKAGDQVL